MHLKNVLSSPKESLIRFSKLVVISKGRPLVEMLGMIANILVLNQVECISQKNNCIYYNSNLERKNTTNHSELYYQNRDQGNIL